MLNKVVIADAGSYAPAGQRLHGLRPVNFVLGANGSGKTTIARALAAPDRFPDCTIGWASGRALDCLVWNSDFSDDNFAAATAPGIFTLGKESIASRNFTAQGPATLNP
ncbi:MAG: AAA family ATPase [Sphingomonas bacterium]|nr:AAA family ATPase [Sphingomonas bacterium]